MMGHTTFNGWLQIALYCVLLILHDQAVRRLHDPRLRRRAHRCFRRCCARWSAASTGSAASTRPQEQHWVAYAVAMLAFSFAGFVGAVRDCSGCRAAAVQSAGPGRGVARPRVQHLGQLRHQHQLAVLRARDDDELPDPDGRADGAQLRLRRHRHRAGDRADPRLRAALGADHRQFLGRSDPLHAVHPAADLDRRRRWSSSGRACRRTSSPIPTRPRWKAPSSSSRRGRWPRRKSIKMLGTNGGGFFNANSAHPFENPNALTNLIQMLLIFSIGAGADQRVRPHGRQPAPGLGDLRRDVRAVPRRRDDVSTRSNARATRPSPRSMSIRRRAHCRPAATWKARRCASASPTRRCSPPSPPMPPAARSTPCTTACCRSPAWCRWSTSCWARSSSAASAPASTACCCSSSSRCSSPG